jgi:O-antigen ligase
VLAGIAIQLIPLPPAIAAMVSPGRSAYQQSSALAGHPPRYLTLALDPRAAAHALTAAFCTIATFWIARAIFARGGVRTVVTALAWVAVGVVLVALAQSAAGTTLVYGFWRPYDAGARPLGPFINRNHCGTWSLLALMLCYGCFQWRRWSSSPSRGWSWRARFAHAFDGRSMILVLAVVLLTIGVALGASRSTMVALAAAAGYVALAAPAAREARRGSLRTLAVVVAASLAFLAYADVGRLLSRIDETRQLGLSQRAAIWRDTLGIIRDFPVAGAGAGNFSAAMKLYQTSDRTYFWNEAHNEYLQVAAEGGLLVAAPAATALIALVVSGWRALRRKDDPTHWMRLGASAGLVGVAVQAIWETGLSLPANGMLAAVAAAILLHQPRHSPNAAAGH